MNNELTHWGIKGQKWGVRRYRNEDGTLTDAGKKRYGVEYRDGTYRSDGYNVDKDKVRNVSSSMNDKELRTAVNRLDMQNKIAAGKSIKDKYKEQVITGVTAAAAIGTVATGKKLVNKLISSGALKNAALWTLFNAGYIAKKAFKK